MDVEGRFSLIWEIENFDIFLLANAGELVSAAWKMETADGDALWWSLSVRQFMTSDYLNVQLVCLNQMLNPDNCDIVFKSSTCGEFVCHKGLNHEYLPIFTIEKTFFNSNKREVHSIIDYQDTLTLDCNMKKKAMKNGKFRIHSVIKKVEFCWYINDPLPPRKKYRPTFHKKIINKDNLLFNMSLNLKRKHLNACAELLPIIDGCFSFVNCKIMCGLLGMTEAKYHEKEVFNSLRTECKQTIVVPDDISAQINLRLESIVIHHNDYKNQIFPTPSRILKAESIPGAVIGPLSEDFLQLYRESILSDATINTEGKSFSAHRIILAARSPVFRAMFEKDETIEGRSGVVDIDDVDSETVDRLLVFLYGDSLENMQWEEASALYYAADKYAVHTLKQKCADILKAGLTVDNVCDALVLADTHSDEQLMKCAVDFIYDHQRVVSFPKFEQLENINPRLTSKVTKELFLKRGKK